MEAAEGFEEFVSTVESGSVTGAARTLELPRATVSRRLAQLEEHLGVRLLHRTTRSMTLTEQGSELYPRARLIVQAAREAVAAVRRIDGVPRGLLRVSVPLGVPAEAFSEMVTGFLRKYPEVKLEVVGSSAHVNLVEEGFDLALRGGAIEDGSLIAKNLVHNRSIIVASPCYLEEHGVPRCPDDLRDHNCIVAYRSGVAPEMEWPLFDGGTVRVGGSFMTNQMELRAAAARRNLGIAMVVDEVVADDLQSGKLVEVLPGVVGRRESVSLVYVDRQFIDPKVRAFVDYIVSRLEEIRALKNSSSP